ncbi:MAG: hypothetical protein IJS95_05145 [Prevotella sp.]|nr:hypothetical protein [Prevotella sp.]
MKKVYIRPEAEEVKLSSINLLLQTSTTEAASDATIFAPELPGFSDDELFQFIMIHQ